MLHDPDNILQRCRSIVSCNFRVCFFFLNVICNYYLLFLILSLLWIHSRECEGSAEAECGAEGGDSAHGGADRVPWWTHCHRPGGTGTTYQRQCTKWLQWAQCLCQGWVIYFLFSFSKGEEGRRGLSSVLTVCEWIVHTDWVEWIPSIHNPVISRLTLVS